jgi:tRNA pseudouridine38-40 synthase
MAYEGAHYAGWQAQLRLTTHATIQGKVEEVLTQVTGDDRRILGVQGAGRTDSGVHALGQVAHDNNNNNNIRAYAGQLISFTHLRALV